mgnify:CR=1 FL=1
MRNHKPTTKSEKKALKAARNIRKNARGKQWQAVA